MKHKKYDRLFIIGLLFLTAALCLAGYNIWKGMQGSISASEVLNQLEPGDGPVTVGEEGMAGFQLKGVTYVGVLEIPELGLQLPVASEWDDRVADHVPCRYTGSPYAGDLIIAGHNYRSHFGGLRNLAPGDEVFFADMEGDIFCYRIVSLETVDGDDVPEMKAGSGTEEVYTGIDAWDLTLFTCNFSGQARLAVRCVEE